MVGSGGGWQVFVLCGFICYFMGAIVFLRIFMLQIGKRKSIEYIINTVGTFMSKERIMLKYLLYQNVCSVICTG